MVLWFMTGNRHKLREVQALIPEVCHSDLDVSEIQELDPQKVIAAKLAEARKHHAGAFLVEDTSLSLHGMGGLPGPLIRWFLASIGVDGLYALSKTFGAKATARTIIGYANEQGDVQFFEGSLEGFIVSPRGAAGFGWDAVFQPSGSEKTFAEMDLAEKQQWSMRSMAIERLQQYLEEQKLL